MSFSIHNLSLSFFFSLVMHMQLYTCKYNKRATETRHCIHMLGYNMAQLIYLVVTDKTKKNKKRSSFMYTYKYMSVIQFIRYIAI